MKQVYAVIMAGGVGSRFWPASRAKTPKQLLDLTGSGRSMIAATVDRFNAMIEEPRRGPVTGWSQDDNWSWCDALFMAPPTMALVSEATGDLRYLDLMNEPAAAIRRIYDGAGLDWPDDTMTWLAIALLAVAAIIIPAALLLLQ